MSVKKIRFRSSLENDALYKVSNTSVAVLYVPNCNGPSVNVCTVITNLYGEQLGENTKL